MISKTAVLMIMGLATSITAAPFLSTGLSRRVSPYESHDSLSQLVINPSFELGVIVNGGIAGWYRPKTDYKGVQFGDAHAAFDGNTDV